MNSEELARRWFDEIWNKKNGSAALELMHPEATGITEGGTLQGPQAFVTNMFEPLVAAFPNFTVNVEGTISEGDQSVVRCTATATHLGPLMHLPASGRKVKFSGMTWFRFRDGKLIEGWDRWNMNALFDLLASGREAFTVQSVV